MGARPKKHYFPIFGDILLISQPNYMSIECKCVPYGSDAYAETVALRDKILRKPLNMVFTPEQLAAEHDQVHVACYQNNVLVGCILLKPIDQRKVKMRQVAVDEALQKQGIGTKMVAFVEAWSQEQGFSLIYCHARAVAEPFYTRMNYRIVGDSFTEVGLKHWLMEKEL